MPEGPDAVVVMGVCGAGKTSVAEGLAAKLGWGFLEGDELHPDSNVARMAAGIPLTDDDRWGWLDAIAGRIAAARAENRPLVISCSSLKRRYRDRLREGGSVSFVYLKADRSTILQRMGARTGHFMPTSLVDSQFADLEEPAPDEAALVCDINLPVAELTGSVEAALAAAKR